MTFVSNDPAFRATYGSTVFVGGPYTGDLPASGTLTLSRPDASIADTLTYGGAGWPDATTGSSLELTDPAPTTTSAPTGPSRSGLRVTRRGQRRRAGRQPRPAPRPSAPPTAGNASATVRWTAPANNGGSAITGYSVRVLDTTDAQVGALRPAAADRDQPGRDRADQRRPVPLPGRRHQQRRHPAPSRLPPPRSPPPRATVPGAPSHRQPDPGRRRRRT